MVKIAAIATCHSRGRPLSRVALLGASFSRRKYVKDSVRTPRRTVPSTAKANLAAESSRHSRKR